VVRLLALSGSAAEYPAPTISSSLRDKNSCLFLAALKVTTLQSLNRVDLHALSLQVRSGIEGGIAD
jgi:hypothetical protein